MPLPLLFIGIAAVSGLTGAGTGVKAGVDHSLARKLNSNSEERQIAAAHRLDALRKQCGSALENLGREKLSIVSGNMKEFLDTFSQIKNVDFQQSVGLNELSKFHIDETSFEEIGELGHFVNSLIAGSAAGITGGALTAVGAYSAASAFATASTGTAISSLSGAAASNATLAFFGGGSLASSGLGMAGGTAVLGGLVAGPALLVMGLIAGAKAGKNLEQAKMNAAEADAACEQLENGAVQCISIRRRTYMFHNLLARIDSYFLPLIYRLKDVVNEEDLDYSTYSAEAKKVVALTVSTALSVKAILDTPILSEDGAPTQEAEDLGKKLTEEVEMKEKME